MNNHQDINNTSFVPSKQQFPNFMSIPSSSLYANNNQTEQWRNSSFWKETMSEIHDNSTEAKTFPFSRIKKVMKSDERVKMISADTPVVFAKACEMFIIELSQRAWIHTEQNKRKTLQRNDLVNAIRDESLFRFLDNVVPMGKDYSQEVPVSAENLQYRAPMMTDTHGMNRSGFWQ